jgi:type II secretory pathway pseudopilin PulG
MKPKFFIQNSYSKFQIPNSKFFSSRSARKAFTLIELLIYSGILVISAGLIFGIVDIASKTNLKTQAENEMNIQMARLEEVFRQKIEASKSIKALSGSLLELNNKDETTTKFSLTDNMVYLEEAGGNPLPLNDAEKVKVTSLLFSPVGGLSAVSMGNHYAWSENIGWIDFAYPGGNVQVPREAGDLKGMAYILSDSSWISLNCLSTDSCSSVNYKVSSDANGNLSLWGWSETYGWISFSCTTGGSNGENICATSNYKVTINPSTGEWDGYAWSENIGWISFNCKTGGASQTNICASSNYKVLDLRSFSTSIKIDLTLEYNSTHPEQQITRSHSFVFNIITPTK